MTGSVISCSLHLLAQQKILNREICLSLFSRDRLAKTKVPALQTLTTLLETIGSQLGDDLKVTKMIEKFFMELTKTSKHTPTVKCNIYILLGVLAQIYPENMTAYSEKLVGLYITALKAEMTSKSKKPELSIITGCLEGLTNYLTNFTQSVDEDSKYSEDIFTYARKAIDPNVNYQRYDAPKAGLKLFSKHASQFNWYLLDDYKSMYEKLRFWSRYHNRDVYT